MTPLESALLDLIRHARGHRLAVPRHETLARLQVMGFEVTDREMRSAKENLVRVYHEPIGSTLNGYFYMVTLDDLRESRKARYAKERAFRRYSIAERFAFDAGRQREVSGRESEQMVLV